MCLYLYKFLRLEKCIDKYSCELYFQLFYFCNTEKPDGSGFGVRHWQAVMVSLGMTLAYILRVNMSVGIVAMTDPDAGNPDYPVS